MNTDNGNSNEFTPELVTPPGFYVKAYRKLIEQFDYKTSLVYGHVHDYCRSVDKETGEVINECWRGQPGLAAELGMDERTVKKALRQLVESGWLTREHRPGKTSKYCIPQAIPIMTPLINVVTTPLKNVGATPLINVVRTESLTHKTTEQEVVVNSDVEELESLELYASKDPKIKSPKAWARAMNDKGISLEEVLSQKPHKRKRKNVDSDSAESTGRYLNGID